MSIVVGTTLRAEHGPLTDVAARLAQRAGVPLRLVHVCEDARAQFVLGTDEEHLLGHVRQRLEEEARRVRALTGVEVHPHLAAGPVVGALTSVAELELADALVVGCGAGSTLDLLGRVAERSARRSVVPVLVLREPERLASWLGGERALRVLVGADGGGAARAARAFAVRLARFGPCELEVVQVVDPREVHARLGLAPPRDEHALEPEAQAVLERELARNAPPQEAATLRVLCARGGADAHLTARADEGGFDLVVVGKRRDSLLESIWYGSVARGVLRAAPVSVASVPAPKGAAAAEFCPPRCVLVATDLADEVDAALAQAFGLVAPGGTVHLVHVLDPEVPSPGRGREQAWSALSRIRPVAGERTAPAFERHLLEGAPAEQLLALASRVGAELLVLAQGERGALSRLATGSVSRAVCERARVPVLLLPRPQA